MKMERPAAVVFEAVRHSFGRTCALDNLDWQVAEKTIHGLIGHNGAGKTTAFFVANKLIPHQQGQVRILGKGIEHWGRFELGRIGLLTEKLKLYQDLLVKDALGFYATLYGVQDQKGVAQSLVETFQLGDCLGKQVKSLSTGMYKKLTIALCLMSSPEIVFLDEPFSGLDPPTLKQISSFIRRYKEESGRTIVLSSHNLHEVEVLADDLTIMRRGKALYSGSLQGLYGHTRMRKSFDLHYLEDGAERRVVVPDEEELATKLLALGSRGCPILAVNENRISLADIYNEFTTSDTSSGSR